MKKETILQRIITLDKENFFKTMVYLETDSKVCTIPHLEFNIHAPSENGVFGNSSILPNQKHVQINTYKNSAEISEEQITTLSSLHGIDSIELTKNVLINEMYCQILKEITKRYTSAGERQRNRFLSKWKKFLRDKFGVEHCFYIKDVNDLQKITSKMGLVIGKESRLGRPDYMIASPEICSLLMDSSLFSSSPMSQVSKGNSCLPMIGKYNEIDVYNNLFSGDSVDLVLGKSSQPQSQGFYFINHSQQFDSIESMGPNGKTVRIQLTSFHSIVEIGESEKLCYSEKVVIGKKPLWRKLLFI